MGLTKIKLGKYIELFSKQCNIPNLTNNDISGVNKEKEFFEPSNQVGSDTSKYKIVPPHYFACNLMHVGRDVVLPIAYNHSGKNKIVSPAYSVFKFRENDELLSDYFFLYLKSEERDRYFWYNTDGSVRDGMSWQDFVNVDIELPSTEIQQKYVDVYNAMLANQQSYERGLEDLKISYEALIDEYKHKATKKRVYNILDEIDNRNVDNAITNVQGINITKQFMPSVANIHNVDLSKYKLVKNGQFAFSGMQTGRDECIRIALYHGQKPIIISPAYTVFAVKDNTVLPEYVMMWFSRKEMDRLGWFMSDSSIRTNLDLDRFYEIEIPIPELRIQKSIVEIYSAYNERRNINEKLKSQIKDICPILIKGSIEEAKKLKEA
ncbi:restriction endonuclease subunit S [Clostridium paraputrificum]|uniref:restriction endonuclease subunit S n=1 Tax=Clostridium paraputrificum TaxID=29363 RepID=UPI00325C2F6C